jgi:hypothetical protein
MMFSLALVITGSVLSLTASAVSWLVLRKLRLSLEAASRQAAARRAAKFDVMDALDEWDTAAREMESGLYSSHVTAAGDELKRLLAEHVLGRKP